LKRKEDEANSNKDFHSSGLEINKTNATRLTASAEETKEQEAEKSSVN